MVVALSLQVRDLLLMKIPFSGEMMEGWERRKKDEHEETDPSEDHGKISFPGLLGYVSILFRFRLLVHVG